MSLSSIVPSPSSTHVTPQLPPWWIWFARIMGSALAAAPAQHRHPAAVPVMDRVASHHRVCTILDRDPDLAVVADVVVLDLDP
eukprot:3520167-Rhodomonas_salina.3